MTQEIIKFVVKIIKNRCLIVPIQHKKEIRQQITSGYTVTQTNKLLVYYLKFRVL